MQNEYFNLLVAGFDKKNEEYIINLAQQIKEYNPEFNLRIQTASEHDEIVNALNESFYKACLLNSELKCKINNKVLNEIQNRLNIQNKTTAIININTKSKKTLEHNNCQENKINLHNSCQDTITEININQLDGYWLAFLIKASIEKLRLKKEIKRLSHYDNLTGLVNRNLYLNHLNHALALAEREKRFCTLIYLDINDFKKINEEYGFKFGDQVLIECAQRIKKTIRSVDIAARLGSDEFAILLENCNPREASRIIYDLKQAMAMPYNMSINKLNLECSVDSASYPDNCSDKTSFLNNVRQAHYLAKTE